MIDVQHGIRLASLHTRFNKTVTADPMAVTAASHDLVNDYRLWHYKQGG